MKAAIFSRFAVNNVYISAAKDYYVEGETVLDFCKMMYETNGFSYIAAYPGSPRDTSKWMWDTTPWQWYKGKEDIKPCLVCKLDGV